MGHSPIGCASPPSSRNRRRRRRRRLLHLHSSRAVGSGRKLEEPALLAKPPLDRIEMRMSGGVTWG
ncbi:hypothetical protein [Bosea sp. OAE506]|uniref:hypothetical protein n=1 Tax=Bosea sp. OAE506 TaxID=2663870 RepID=UPI00339AF0F6